MLDVLVIATGVIVVAAWLVDRAARQASTGIAVSFSEEELLPRRARAIAGQAHIKVVPPHRIP